MENLNCFQGREIRLPFEYNVRGDPVVLKGFHEPYETTTYSDHGEELFLITNPAAVELIGHFFINLKQFSTNNNEKNKQWEQIERFLNHAFNLKKYTIRDFPNLSGTRYTPIDSYREYVKDGDRYVYKNAGNGGETKKLPVEIKKVQGLIGFPPRYIRTTANQIIWLKTKGDFGGIYLLASIETSLRNVNDDYITEPYISVWKIDATKAGLVPIKHVHNQPSAHTIADDYHDTYEVDGIGSCLLRQNALQRLRARKIACIYGDPRSLPPNQQNVCVRYPMRTRKRRRYC